MKNIETKKKNKNSSTIVCKNLFEIAMTSIYYHISKKKKEFSYSRKSSCHRHRHYRKLTNSIRRRDRKKKYIYIYIYTKSRIYSINLRPRNRFEHGSFNVFIIFFPNRQILGLMNEQPAFLSNRF